MSDAVLYRAPIPRAETERLAKESFEDMVKFVIDLERRLICAGGGLHVDEEHALLADGSEQKNLWGANYYLFDSGEERFQYTSMINIRPEQGNRSQRIESEAIRRHVKELAVFFFESPL